MNKVYTLGINNFDALDGYMTSTDIKVFFDKAACEKWIKEETKRQAKKGFNLLQINLTLISGCLLKNRFMVTIAMSSSDSIVR